MTSNPSTMTSNPRVCIVGAGMSGLVSIKECKNVGLNPICYELHSSIGGIWTPDRDSETSNSPRAWDSLITNTTRFVMNFSDFQVTPDTPQYMTRQALTNYYQSYADHFQLTQHIRLNTRVVKVRKTDDHDTTGRWEVYTCPTADFNGGDARAGVEVTEDVLGLCFKEVFDVVLVCSGFFKVPSYPDIPGLKSFPGLVKHSFDYKSPEPFIGKKVLVVGNSFSAGDIANDVTIHTDKPVDLCLGRGTWIWPRVFPGGVATDRYVTRHQLYTMNPDAYDDMIIGFCQSRFDHIGSGINPALPPSRAPLMMGDDIYLKILTDRIRIQDQLVRFTGNIAEYKNGSKSEELDAVVVATGYKLDTSFVDLKIKTPEGKLDLFNMMLPIHERHHTLGFIGFLVGDGPPAPPTELQARYMARLITGKIPAPSYKQMVANTQMLADMSLHRRGKYSYSLSLLTIGDMIAKDLGVLPNFWRLLLKDPLLAYRFWYGPMFSAYYRLFGPDSNWEQARASCYRGMEVLTATPSSRPKVKIVRGEVTWCKHLLKFVGLSCCGVAAVISVTSLWKKEPISSILASSLTFNLSKLKM